MMNPPPWKAGGCGPRNQRGNSRMARDLYICKWLAIAIFLTKCVMHEAVLSGPSSATNLVHLHFLPGKLPIVRFSQLTIFRHCLGLLVRSLHNRQSCTWPPHTASLFPTTSLTLRYDICTCRCHWFVISLKELVCLYPILLGDRHHRR